MSVKDDIKKATELQKQIAVNALQCITEELVSMENSGKNEKEMMDDCVWPILTEASKRYEQISLGDLNVETGNFKFVVKE